ncbi:MAG: tlpA [Micavibrio sp.]|nr:tlpA [Micavibrio sp.]
MKYCLLMVLAAVLLSVTDASAAGNAEDLQKKFSSQFSLFYDLTGDRRGMLPFTMIDAEGKETTLGQFKGRFVVLHFWATWCPPCIKELPKLKAFKSAKEGKDLAVVMVSLDYGAENDKIDKFMKKQGIDGLPSYRVPTTDPAWDQLTAFGLPGTFLIDKKGQVLYKVVGDTEWSAPESTDFINYLIANQTK